VKICVNEISKHGLDITKEIAPSTLQLDTSQIHYPSGIKVSTHLERDKETVFVKCVINAQERKICSRCLEAFDTIFTKQADFVYKIGNEHTIDLSDNIKDTIILEYPIKQLCKPDCRGLCQKCGANLNNGRCNCNL
jgi:uncharacterized protein